MKVKTNDQLHISSLSPNTIAPGATIEVSDTVGKDLVKRGLATAVGGNKEAATPKNKKAAAPKNK